MPRLTFSGGIAITIGDYLLRLEREENYFRVKNPPAGFCWAEILTEIFSANWFACGCGETRQIESLPDGEMSRKEGEHIAGFKKHLKKFSFPLFTKATAISRMSIALEKLIIPEADKPKKVMAKKPVKSKAKKPAAKKAPAKKVAAKKKK